MSDVVLANYLDGELPTTADEVALLERLDTDPALAADCAGQALIHALLPVALDDEQAAAAMAARVVARLATPAATPVRRRPWLLAVVAAAAVLALVLLVPFRAAQPAPAWQIAATTIDLELPQRSAQLRIAAGTRYRLGPSPGPDVDLATGTIDVAIARPLATPFTLMTPAATATVLGTAFRVHADAQGTGLEVQRGLVSLSGSDGPPVEINAGQGSRCRRDGIAEVPHALPPMAPLLDQILPDGDPARWRTKAAGGSQLTLSNTADDGIAAAIVHGGTAADWTWFGRSLACAQDWRGAAGLSLEVQSDGPELVIEVGGFRPGGGDYYFSSATVSASGPAWRTVQLPFSAFGRYPGHQAEVSGPVTPILGTIAHVGIFPGACSQVAVRRLRLWHLLP